jgi:hypothetical protein
MDEPEIDFVSFENRREVLIKERKELLEGGNGQESSYRAAMSAFYQASGLDSPENEKYLDIWDRTNVEESSDPISAQR